MYTSVNVHTLYLCHRKPKQSVFEGSVGTVSQPVKLYLFWNRRWESRLDACLGLLLQVLSLLCIVEETRINTNDPTTGSLYLVLLSAKTRSHAVLFTCLDYSDFSFFSLVSMSGAEH